MVKSYAKGCRLENRARTILEKQGHYVIRSAGSKGLIDLVAVKWNGIKLIQVKSRGILKAEIDAIIDFKVPQNVHKEIWLWDVNTRSFQIQKV